MALEPAAGGASKSDTAEYEELRKVLDELNWLATPDAIAQHLARVEFRSVPGEAYQCTMVHYLQERVQLAVNVSTTHAAIEGGPMIPLPPIVAEYEKRDAEAERS